MYEMAVQLRIRDEFVLVWLSAGSGGGRVLGLRTDLRLCDVGSFEATKI